MIQIGNFLINFWVIIPSIIVVVFLMIGIRFVRPVDSVLVERFGKFVKKLNPGFNFIIPIIESAIYVNMTENMVDVPPQTVITRDKLNVEVDAVVYYRVADANKAIYNIKDYKGQLISLARTTLRALLGKMTLSEANENRKEINAALEESLDKETVNYGVYVLRVEIQKIEPPRDIVEAMNGVFKAEQFKIAAKEQALALQEKAEGEKQAKIKEAEGMRQQDILIAEGKSRAIQLVNEAAEKYFKGGAIFLKQLEVAQATLQQNTKLIVPQGSNLINLIGDAINVSTKTN